MRLAFRIDTNFTALGAALCVALASMALPIDVFAADAASVPATSAPSASFTGSAVTATPALEAAADSTVAVDTSAESGDSTAQAPGVSADAASVNDIVLDDQMLSRQRGGAAGMVMVAAAPQLRGGSVTLWDEIAPPTPLPIPVDAARAQQSNVASYVRK
ncbi:hypothetical protein P3T23_006435 [Paraburkholderia sp. GAS448]|uniref:hypothetical protein n=1 Tax=Paraburkholderia sp. GAS448 TaxID=3035136 RepID=UPI003D20CD4A